MMMSGDMGHLLLFRRTEGQGRRVLVAATPRHRTRATATAPTQTPALKIPSMAVHPAVAIARLVTTTGGAIVLIRSFIRSCSSH
jgi:hypothetical protein